MLLTFVKHSIAIYIYLILTNKYINILLLQVEKLRRIQ